MTMPATRMPDFRSLLDPLRFVPVGQLGDPRGSCDDCGLYIWSDGGYRVPGLKGIFCSLVCLECAIAKHTGQTKRIPGAPIGSGARLLAYLRIEAPALYRTLLGQRAAGSGFCQNPNCPNGEDGQPASLAHLRADALYCNRACQKAAQRSPNRQNRASNRQCLCGSKGDKSGGMVSWVN